MAKPKPTAFPFEELGATIKENSIKNQNTIQEKIDKEPFSSNNKNNNLVVTKEKEISSSEHEHTNELENNDKMETTQEQQVLKKGPGRPTGSKNRLKDVSDDNNPLSNILQKKEKKIQITAYLEESKINKIDDICKQYSDYKMSRNTLISFLIESSLENL